MANSCEVAKKVKDAIKAKLVEIGAYVDDELPDYIMVLVANKKNKDQMDEDLSLFLGHNTERFTSWLHGVLQKLNAASFLQTQQKEISPEIINDAILMKERLELKKEKSEKRKDKKMKKKKKSKNKKVNKKMSKTVEKSSEILQPDTAEVASTVDKCLDKDRNSVEISVSKDSVRKETDILDIQTNPQDFSLESDEEPITKEAPPIIIQRTIHQNVIAPEEFATQNKNETSNHKKISIHNRLGPVNLEKNAIKLKEDNLSLKKSTIEKKSGMGRVLSSSIASAIRSVTQKDRSGHIQTKLEARIKPVMSDRVKRSLSDEENENKPKKCMKLTSVVRPVSQSNSSGVTSKVEIVSRPRRAGSGQANTALILRAVADAHKSVNRIKKRKIDDQTEELLPAKRKQIFTKRYQDQMKDMEEPKPRKMAITVSNVHAHDSPVQDEHSSEEQSIQEDSDDDSEQVVEYHIKEDIAPVKLSDGQTKFFITMDGIAEKNIKGRLGSRRNSNLEDEYIEEVEEWEEVEEASMIQETTPQTAPVQKVDMPIVAVKKDEKCKFWPECKEGESCRFSHPNKTCIMFPNCKFGSNCVYIHPQCKFDSSCTKFNCPFSHPTKPAVSSIGVVTSKMKCRFFPKCTDMNCPFQHPKQICRFGNFCKTVHCAYIHPTVTYGSKLKWIAPKSLENPKSEEPIKT